MPERTPARPAPVLVGWLPCTCGNANGHRTYYCTTGTAVVYEPDRHRRRTGPDEPTVTADLSTAEVAAFDAIINYTTNFTS